MQINNPFFEISNELLIIKLELTTLKTKLDKVLHVKSKRNEVMNSDFIFIDEVCILTNLKHATIYNFVHYGKIPTLKKTGQRLLIFSKNQIIEWLKQGRPTNDNFIMP